MKKLAWVLAALAVVGCSDEGTPVGGDGGTPIVGRLLPLGQGNTWTYWVDDGVLAGEKRTEVMALEDVGGEKAGVMAFHVRTEKLGGGVTRSWQEDRGTSVVRHRERTFDATGLEQSDEVYLPAKLRIDESPAHLVVGATWRDEYTEKITDVATGTWRTATKIEVWTVEAVDEEVTVPAGTFRTVRLRRAGDVSGTTTADKTYWFAAGVGKVRETGKQTEELTGYSIPTPGAR